MYGVRCTKRALLFRLLANRLCARRVVFFRAGGNRAMVRTPRDHDILKTLAVKVRILSLTQIAEAWWRDASQSPVHARRRLSILRDTHQVHETTVPASPLLKLTIPLVVWKPGQPTPDLATVARKLVDRWPAVPARPIRIFSATEATNNLYGGPRSVRPINVAHVDHDLHVGQVYLYFLRKHPALAACWQGEDVRPKSGYRLKDPDAVLELDGGRRIHAVEFGGRYDVERVRDFHEDCAKRHRSYELW